ncbi:TIGD4 [Cordylochernes scorpioides]|uniref:TIGD4 n=1 Tax=Cordylochernes scorpioides TaxID=51811 RepID=A0ABY6KJB2_9ARAC|nr:TIGD4 [Cordylochernes scorpioides]
MLKLLKRYPRMEKEIEVEKKKKTDVAQKHNIPQSSLSTIIKYSEKIHQQALHAGESSRKRARGSTYADVDEALLQWFKQARSAALPVNGPLLSEKAKTLALEFGLKDFTGSGGWIERWKARHGIKLRNICGETADVNRETMTNWLTDVMPNIISNYACKDIFNADETGLFWRLLPDKTLHFKGETFTGGKASKERITILLCCNMDGSEKMQPLVIGKAKQPRCFRGIKHLPVQYEANQKAWMTGLLFESWVRHIDKKMAGQHRQIILLLDNCGAHPPDMQGLTNTRIAFLPPNTTSMLQPCDQGIIRNFKMIYRTRLMRKYLTAYDAGTALTINLKQAVDIISVAWNDVLPATISNCWHHSGIIKSDVSSPLDTPQPATQMWEQQSLFDRMKEVLKIPLEMDFDSYADADNDVVTNAMLSDVEIVESILQAKEEEETDQVDEEVDPIVHIPHPKEVLESIQTLRLFLQCQDESKSLHRHLSDLDNIEKSVQHLYNHWDETLCLTKVYFYLSGTALKWFENNEESIQTWKEFTSQLENVFGKKENSKLQAEKKLKTRAQLKGESTGYYIQDLLCLCKEVDPQMSEEDKISHLMKGIAEELYQALLLRDVQSTEQFITECRRVEALRCRRVTPTRYERLPNVASLCDQDDGEDLSSMIRQIVREEIQQALDSPHEEPKIAVIEDLVREEIVKTLAPRSKPTINPPQASRPESNTRYEAQTIRPHPEPHYRKQGRRCDTNEWRTTEGKPICFYCGRPGHVVRYCRDRKRHNEERRKEYFQRKQDAMTCQALRKKLSQLKEDIPTERTLQPQTREKVSGPITRSRALRLRIFPLCLNHDCLYSVKTVKGLPKCREIEKRERAKMEEPTRQSKETTKQSSPQRHSQGSRKINRLLLKYSLLLGRDCSVVWVEWRVGSSIFALPRFYLDRLPTFFVVVSFVVVILSTLAISCDRSRAKSKMELEEVLTVFHSDEVVLAKTDKGSRRR